MSGAIPAHGHMPFPGHRSQGQIWAAQEKAKLRAFNVLRSAFGYPLIEEEDEAA